MDASSVRAFGVGLASRNSEGAIRNQALALFKRAGSFAHQPRGGAVLETDRFGRP
jgi:hypothetical protein